MLLSALSSEFGPILLAGHVGRGSAGTWTHTANGSRHARLRFVIPAVNPFAVLSWEKRPATWDFFMLTCVLFVVKVRRSI